jgi:predicted RNA-binding Zn-ribbon protein involved in translation (DUF1610 family)
MGHKTVCLSCRKAFNVSFSNTDSIDRKCPQCAESMVFLDHKFRPPAQTNVNEWQVVKFLFEKGFIYQHVYEKYERSGYSVYVPYPRKMTEAENFVEKYKDQSILNRRKD